MDVSLPIASFYSCAKPWIQQLKLLQQNPHSSNGLVERQNMTIANMLDKILEDQQLGLDVALSWFLNVKNSLPNVHELLVGLYLKSETPFNV